MKEFLIKNKKPIIRGLAELLIIFAGITASLLIDDWRQRRADQELAMQYMRSMYVDAFLDLHKLEEHVFNWVQRSADCYDILNAMHFPDSFALSEEEFRHKFGKATRLDKFVCTDNTFRDLTLTGNIKLIE